jgi:FMN phosphatase YigB (HAD superfamily)
MVLILDLDDTIYQTSAIGKELLFKAIVDVIKDNEVANIILSDVKSSPIANVFRKYNWDTQMINSFYDALTNQAELLKIKTFEDYEVIKHWHGKKYLVTTGYPSWQKAKINHLSIQNDFEKIFIHDINTDLSKLDFLKEILSITNLPAMDHYVIGDNPHNELKFGYELGMKTIQRRSKKRKEFEKADWIVEDFIELARLFE